MKFLLKYPSRERPEFFAQTVKEWNSRASKPADIKWLVSLDQDDPRIAEYRSKCDAFEIDPIIGKSSNKIDACNRDLDAVRAADWDTLILVCDDMRPVVSGWDLIIKEQMPVLDMALWFVDGRRGDLCTLSIFGRPIFEWMKCIYHPAFESVYCDDYFHTVLEREGKLKRVGEPLVFEHRWKKENDDALMKRNENSNVYVRDKATFDRLMANYLKTGVAW